MQENEYQYNFAASHSSMYDVAERTRKANKVLAVLKDHHGVQTQALSLLDIGCSTGILTELLSSSFGSVVGIDIDEPAIDHARQHYSRENIKYEVGDAMRLSFPDAHFDVVTCMHIYEHVPEAARMMAEIYRVLRPGGVCYFAAYNRFVLVEGDYGLPLLSALPKPLADLYVRAAGKGRCFYEKPLSLWGLRRLVSLFTIIDYTVRVIADPVRFCADDMLTPGSRKQRFAHWLVRHSFGYWLCPTYIWLLCKPHDKDPGSPA